MNILSTSNTNNYCNIFQSFSTMLRLILVILCITFHYFSFATGFLVPPESSYNILILIPISFKSHRNVFMPIATGLAKRGHNVRFN